MDTILQFIRDQAWQFGGFVVGMIGIIAATAIAYRQRQRKQLTYEILTYTPVLGIDKHVKDRVKVLYGDQEVTGVDLVEIKLTNTGNVAILPSDFIKEVTIAFPEGSRVLSAQLLEIVPIDLDAAIAVHPESCAIVLAPVLLNQSDAVTIQALVDIPKNKRPILPLADSKYTGLSVLGRVVGVKSIGNRKDSGRKLTEMAIVILMIPTIPLFLIVVVDFIKRHANEPLVVGAYILFMAILVAGVVRAEYLMRRKRTE